MPSEHRKIDIKNTNTKTIQDIQTFENVGTQIDVSEYLNFESGYFLGTISCMNGLLYDETKWEKISPNIYESSSKKLKKGDYIISRNASLGKISYVHKNSNIILNGGLSYLRIKDKYRWYFPAFFMTNYGAEYLTCATSGWGTQQNAKRQNLLDVTIPFPTLKNHKNPEQVEEYISLLVQNMIDKEEQIRAKNEKIDAFIEQELTENQKEWVFVYKFPKIWEIRNEGRLDTGLYEREYKEIWFIIKNYISWKFTLSSDELLWGNTPKERILEPQNKNYLWFTPSDIKTGILKEKHYIKSTKYNLTDKFALLFSNRSNCWEGILYTPHLYSWGHHNQWVYRKEFMEENLILNLFILCLFNSTFLQNLIQKYANWATFSELRIDQFTKIFIPDFPPEKKSEIAREYYHPQNKNENMTPENYIKSERIRNSQVGIFQLNMELFELRERLEEVVDAIVQERKIEIVL